MRFYTNKFQDYIPKLFLCIKEGYSKQYFLNDLLAGVSVGIIALPLAIAFAIASGVSPERGLFTAIVAGFLVSLLGGSRVQIGGPTGAFVVIVLGVVQRHGYEGLALATLIAGVLIILMGLARFGILLKFIPYPVTTGFTTGIALIIFMSQLKDFFGLQVDSLPPQFLEKCTFLCLNFSTLNIWALLIGSGTLISIFLFRQYYPKLPGAIIAISFATLITSLFNLPLQTIESMFGEIPRMLPSPSLPTFSYDLMKRVFPDAITIALLGAIESLLSAMVADGMIGHKHRSNGELVAQGIANIGSVIFGGIPATGAIARTTANIKMGAKTPIAGMIHAITLLLLMLLFAPFAGMIPLSALAAVLIFVAWNMSCLGHFYEILKGQKSEALILLATFLLTVLIDLTVAIQVGVVLAAVLFVKKMSDNTSVDVCRVLLKENENEGKLKDSEILLREDIPEDITVFEINGPFFYSVADLLDEVLIHLNNTPRVFILRMEAVPIIDATGIKALREFKIKCNQKGILFIMCGLKERVMKKIPQNARESLLDEDHFSPTFSSALSYAKKVKLD